LVIFIFMIKLKSLLTENISSEVANFENGIKSRYPQLEEFGIYYDATIKALFFSDLYIKEEFKEQGIGSKIMMEVNQFADRLKVPIVLIPESEDDDQQRLIRFYKKFGFIVNTGKNMDYAFRVPGAVSMYRMPH
jgi:GNAT superfamily N-acetyltransferase